MASQTISKKNLDQIMAYVITRRADQLRELLNRNGYASAANLSREDVQRSFLKAIKDSPSFRQDASQFFAEMVVNDSKDTAMAFSTNKGQWRTIGSNKPKGSKKLNAVGVLNETGDAGEGWTADTSTGTKTPTPTSSTSGGSFWNTLGSVVNKDTLTSLFNTGLGAVSTSLQAKANKDSEERALELERIRLQQIQAQKDLKEAAGGDTPKDSGLPGWAVASIVVGGLAIVGTVVYLIAKK